MHIDCLSTNSRAAAQSGSQTRMSLTLKGHARHMRPTLHKYCTQFRVDRDPFATHQHRKLPALCRFQGELLSIQARWQGAAKPFGSAYNMGIGDTVTEGKGMSICELDSSQPTPWLIPPNTMSHVVALLDAHVSAGGRTALWTSSVQVTARVVCSANSHQAGLVQTYRAVWEGLHWAAPQPYQGCSIHGVPSDLLVSRLC